MLVVGGDIKRECLIYFSPKPGARIYVICNTVVVDTSLAQGLIRLRLFYSHGNIAGPPLSDSITFPQLIQTRGQSRETKHIIITSMEALSGIT